MLSQTCKNQHEGDAKGTCKRNAGISSRADWVDGGEAARGIDPAAILMEQNRDMRFVAQEALRAIGYSAVAVDGVVEVLEDGKVEMPVAKDDIGVVVANREVGFGAREEFGEDIGGHDVGRSKASR